MSKGRKTGIIVAILVAVLVLYHPVVRWLVTPSAVRAAWVEPLADADHFRTRAELPTFGRPPEKSYRHFDTVLQANDQKRRLFRAIQTGQGKAGLLRRFSSVEGRLILTWLLVDDGRVTYVHDSTRDDWASPAAVDTHTPKTVKLGFYSSGLFVEGEPGPNDSPKIVLEVDLGSSRKIYFH